MLHIVHFRCVSDMFVFDAGVVCVATSLCVNVSFVCVDEVCVCVCVDLFHLFVIVAIVSSYHDALCVLTSFCVITIKFCVCR